MAHRPSHRRAFEGIESVAERSADAIVITNAVGVIEFVNPAFEAMTGFTRTEAVGLTPAILKSGRLGADFYRDLWATIRAGKVFRGMFANRRKNGQLFREDEVIIPFVDAAGLITHFVSAGTEASARVGSIDRLMHQATHDSLTDLPNRSLFLDRLSQALKYAARRSEGFTLAIADIDRFKTVNDTLGHAAGDAVLQAVALRLQQYVREVDTVARLGGDEFGVILVDVGDSASASKAFEKIVMAFQTPVRAEGRAVHVTLSIGACMFPSGADTATSLLKRADATMYAAKRAGGNAYFFFGAAALPRRETQLPLWETLPTDLIDERVNSTGVIQ